MKLAVSNIAWPRGADREAAEVLAGFGISGVEIAPTLVWADAFRRPESEVTAYRRRWESRGFRIVALQALLFGRPELLLFGDEAVRRELAAHLGLMARLGGWLGAGVLVLGAPRNRQRGTLALEAALTLAVPVLREVAAAAERHGVTLCIEPNPPRYGCDFVVDSREGLDLVGRVAHAGFGLHLDAAAMTLAGEPAAAAIGSCGAAIRHFHASEPDLVPLGTGGVDHAAFAAALRSLPGERWVSMEARAQEPDPWPALRRSLWTLAKAYGGKPGDSADGVNPGR